MSLIIADVIKELTGVREVAVGDLFDFMDTEFPALVSSHQALQNTVANTNTTVATKVAKTSDNGAMLSPLGTTAQRPVVPVNGMIRYNTEFTRFEGYQDGAWGSISAGAPTFSVQWWPQRSSIPAGYVAADGQLLSRATYPSAFARIVAGDVPTVAEATWVTTNTERGKYTLGDGTTTFRMPDYNGVVGGSLGAVFLRGDGASSAGLMGVIQRDAMQGHRHAQVGSGPGATYTYSAPLSNTDNGKTAFSDGVREPVSDGLNGTPRTSAETRPLNVTGCWIVKIFAEVINTANADFDAINTRLTAAEYQWDSGWLNTPISTKVVITHNQNRLFTQYDLLLRAKNADNGFSVGEIIIGKIALDHMGTTAAFGIQIQEVTQNTFALFVGGAYQASTLTKSGSAIFSPGATNWEFKIIAR